MNSKNCCAYPFIYDKSPLCDYEIATDSLASHLGFAKSFCKEKDLEYDILELIELVYHCNGSARGFCSITQEDFSHIEEKFLRYREKTKHLVEEKFVLPQGGNLGSALHICRSLGKNAVRQLYFVKESGKEVSPILFDFLNLITNYIFSLCLYANNIEGIKEITFTSKSY